MNKPIEGKKGAGMIDWTKPVWTKGDHLPVEVKFTDGRGSEPVAAYVGDSETIFKFTLDGRYYGLHDSSYNLENVPEPEVWWLNLYPGGNHDLRVTRDDASGGSTLFKLTRTGDDWTVEEVK